MQTRKGNQPPLANVFDPQLTAHARQRKAQLAQFEEQLARRVTEARPLFEAWARGASAA